ncbi:MAG: 50S ribosomal protein L32 [Candidatus Levybacteria bacterium]|nr:50S ribosomal protein L32 [Candidatus Levybacteria bacterium]
MAHEPKKRHSRARQGKRRNHIKLAVNASIVCPNCEAPQISHSVCATCGFYKGVQVIQVKQPKHQAAANS